MSLNCETIQFIIPLGALSFHIFRTHFTISFEDTHTLKRSVLRTKYHMQFMEIFQLVLYPCFTPTQPSASLGPWLSFPHSIAYSHLSPHSLVRIVIPVGNVMITHHWFFLCCFFIFHPIPFHHICKFIEFSTFIELWRQFNPVHLINLILYATWPLFHLLFWEKDRISVSSWFPIHSDLGFKILERFSICQIGEKSKKDSGMWICAAAWSEEDWEKKPNVLKRQFEF